MELEKFREKAEDILKKGEDMKFKEFCEDLLDYSFQKGFEIQKNKIKNRNVDEKEIEKLVEIKQIDNPYTQILEKKDEVLRDLTREFIKENITEPNNIADKIKEKFTEVNFDENKIEAMNNKIFYTVNDVIKNEYKELLKDKEKGKEKEEIEY